MRSVSWLQVDLPSQASRAYEVSHYSLVIATCILATKDAEAGRYIAAKPMRHHLTLTTLFWEKQYDQLL
jgi:hypothetical protein